MKKSGNNESGRKDYRNTRKRKKKKKTRIQGQGVLLEIKREFLNKKRIMIKWSVYQEVIITINIFVPTNNRGSNT